MKKLEDWNRAANVRHIWTLFTKSGSLWVAWVNLNLIKGRCVWLLKVPQKSAWSWKKILEHRLMAKIFLKFLVGDGSKIY